MGPPAEADYNKVALHYQLSRVNARNAILDKV